MHESVPRQSLYSAVVYMNRVTYEVIPLPGKPGQFHFYGHVEPNVLSHVTFMPVLIRPANNFLGQVIGSASEGEYNNVNNSTSGEVTYQQCLNFGDYPIFI